MLKRELKLLKAQLVLLFEVMIFKHGEVKDILMNITNYLQIQAYLKTAKMNKNIRKCIIGYC